MVYEILEMPERPFSSPATTHGRGGFCVDWALHFAVVVVVAGAPIGGPSVVSVGRTGATEVVLDPVLCNDNRTSQNANGPK